MRSLPSKTRVEQRLEQTCAVVSVILSCRRPKTMEWYHPFECFRRERDHFQAGMRICRHIVRQSPQGRKRRGEDVA